MAYETYDKKQFETEQEANAYSLEKGVGYHQVPTYGTATGAPPSDKSGYIFNPNTNKYENRNASGQLMNPEGTGNYTYNQGTGQFEAKTPPALSSSGGYKSMAESMAEELGIRESAQAQTDQKTAERAELKLNQEATMVLLQLLMKWYPLDAMGQI